MAAPVPTPRTLALTGFRMPDGFRSLVTLQNSPAIQLWEHAAGGVKPPGFDGGEPVNTTTMHNNAWRTKRARKLKEMTPCTFKAAYDPDVLPAVLQQINLEQSITFLYPDGSTLAFWGFLQKFESGGMEEGKMPEADCTVVPTNVDPVGNPGGEDGPVFTPALGT